MFIAGLKSYVTLVYKSQAFFGCFVYHHGNTPSWLKKSNKGQCCGYQRSSTDWTQLQQVGYWYSEIRNIGLYFWGVRGSWAECHFLFSLVYQLCLALWQKSILGCLWPLVFVLNNTLILGIWCSIIPHLPGCFCRWTFLENIGFNTVLMDPFMSHLATELGYSAGEFQALQLIVLAAFGVVDLPLASCMLVHLLEIEF